MAGKILFVPVSGPAGMGEFARARSLADELRACRPDVAIHFLLHRDAPYAKGFHHPCTLLPASPTLCSDEVNALIERLRPDVVIFDNAGRTSQLRAAKRVGARVIYISSRGRQRYKAFRLRWMRMLDEHWISYPEIIAGALGPFERLKWRLLRRPRLRFLDAVIPTPDEAAVDTLLPDLPRPDVVIVPGGGSAFHDVSMTPARFARWAEALAARGLQVVFVAGPAFSAEIAVSARLRVLRGLPGGVLMALLRRSRWVLVNGGDTLLQALVLDKPCIAIPIAGDQARRIARCVAQGVVLAPHPDAVVDTCERVLRDSSVGSALAAARRQLALQDALPDIIQRLEGYLSRT